MEVVKWSSKTAMSSKLVEGGIEGFGAVSSDFGADSGNFGGISGGFGVWGSNFGMVGGSGTLLYTQRAAAWTSSSVYT